MQIVRLIWEKPRLLKIARKHHLTPKEVDQACFNPGALTLKGPKVRKKKENRYLVYSRTDTGRYILVVLEPYRKGEPKVITARPLTDKEKQMYKRKTGGSDERIQNSKI